MPKTQNRMPSFTRITPSIIVKQSDPLGRLTTLAHDIARRANEQGKPIVGCYSALDRECPPGTSVQDRDAVVFGYEGLTYDKLLKARQHLIENSIPISKRGAL